MPSILSHPAPILALATLVPQRLRTRRIVLAAVGCSVLPDVDVAGFAFGIPYGHVLGHRGITHGLPFALALGAVVAAGLAQASGERFVPLWLFLTAATASHGCLDAMTNGGLGVAFLAPFSNRRWFFPVRPIEVSPIGLDRFLSPRGVAVLASELRVVWLPSAMVAATALALRRRTA